MKQRGKPQCVLTTQFCCAKSSLGTFGAPTPPASATCSAGPDLDEKERRQA